MNTWTRVMGNWNSPFQHPPGPGLVICWRLVTKFKVTMKGGEWAETTLAKPQEKSESGPGLSVRFVSWSGKFDR